MVALFYHKNFVSRQDLPTSCAFLAQYNYTVSKIQILLTFDCYF